MIPKSLWWLACMYDKVAAFSEPWYSFCCEHGRVTSYLTLDRPPQQFLKGDVRQTIRLAIFRGIVKATESRHLPTSLGMA